MVNEQDQRRALVARLAAPVAFFIAATVLIILIEAGLNGGRGTATSPGAAVTSSGTTAGTTTAPKKKRVYRVRSGDTLESIAAKFHTTVDDLLRLNPSVDPLALSPGQKIRVS